MSIESLKYVIRGILSESGVSKSKRLDEIGALVALGLGALGAGAGISAGKEAFSKPSEAWIKGVEVCKKKTEFDTTLGADPNKKLNVKLSRYVMPTSASNREVNFEDVRAKAEAALMITIDSAYSITTEDGESVLLYTSAGSISRATKEFNTRSCQQNELKPGGVVYDKLKSAYGANQQNFKRQLAIASIDSDEKLSNSSSFNGSKHYYVISKCSNDYLRSEIESEQNWQKSDASLAALSVVDWLKKLVTADRSLWNPTGIGDEIEKLSPGDKAWLVNSYNKYCSIFGLLGFVHPIFSVATIGMNLVLGLYYQRVEPNAKFLGVSLSTINFVGAGLCAFSGATSASIFARQTSDISIMASHFSKVRNINGLPELGIVAAGTQSSSFTVQHLRNFCRLFPELQNPNNWVKVSNGWNYAQEGGMLMVDASGKVVTFSDDVKNFIGFYQKYPSIVTQYIEWYQGMPGILGKLMITSGAVLDVVTLKGIFDTPAGIFALSEAQSVTIDISAANPRVIISALKREITPQEIQSFVDKTPLGSVTIVNQKTKLSKVIAVDFDQNDLSYVIEHMLNKSGSSDFETTAARVFIVDEELYDNFELFIDYPALFDKSYINPGESSNNNKTQTNLEKRSTIAYKLSPSVYVLLTTSSARELASLKKTVPYNERIDFYDQVKEKLNTIQKLKQLITIVDFLNENQPKTFDDLDTLPSEYRLRVNQQEKQQVESMFPFYTLEVAMDQFPDAILQSADFNQKLDVSIDDLKTKLAASKTDQQNYYEKYYAAVLEKQKKELEVTKRRYSSERGPRY